MSFVSLSKTYQNPYSRSKLFINAFLSGAACGKAQAKECIVNNFAGVVASASLFAFAVRIGKIAVTAYEQFIQTFEVYFKQFEAVTAPISKTNHSR